MELYTDTYYVRRILAGDTASFACLIDRYSRPVHSLIFKMTRNKEDAEELTQDVFMKVFRSLASFRGESSFSTWIYRIACRTAISEVRKRKREFLPIDESLIANVAEEMPAGMFGADNESEQIGRLEKALGMLPPDEQAMILLFYAQEKSIGDIASIAGLSAPNVKTRLHRIRKKLFAALAQMEEQENE
jgi:RNA polymerase sigma-70 factor (ECF subfamily)